LFGNVTGIKCHVIHGDLINRKRAVGFSVHFHSVAQPLVAIRIRRGHAEGHVGTDCDRLVFRLAGDRGKFRILSKKFFSGKDEECANCSECNDWGVRLVHSNTVLVALPFIPAR
jgi:hypothetical protein